MKKLINKTIALLVLLILVSCNSDDDGETIETLKTFDQLTKNDIEALETTMSDADLNAANETGVLWENGKILLYKTNEGRFGKMKVLNIDIEDNYKLTIEVVTFATDGLVYNSNSFFEVPGTWVPDLDEIVLDGADHDQDFHWSRFSTTTRIAPRNGFVFVEYNLN